MTAPWMPFYVGDYLKDTRSLSTLEHGAYLLLIMEYWQQGSLPLDETRLARIAGLTPAEWKVVRAAIAPYFNDGWRHSRIDEEIAKVAEKSGKAKQSAERRWGANANAYAKANAKRQPKANANAHTNAHANGYADVDADGVRSSCYSQPQSSPSSPEENSQGEGSSRLVVVSGGAR